jgi:threonine dehydrogenase-like Zn-dependent dehydrogenase
MARTSTAFAIKPEATTMRAVVIAGPRKLVISESVTPEPAAHEIRVRIEGCGVCASNLDVWEGRNWFSYPRRAGAPGHDAWGRVETVGSEVKNFSAGDYVTMLSSCSFAEFDVARANEVVRLPDSLVGRPFPGESLACAMNIFRRAEIHAGQDVAVVGVGFLGALLTQLAARAGARVIAISRRPYALEVARRCGAAETIPMDDHRRVIEAVVELTSGRGCDRVIEAVGEQWPLDLATELTRERGRLIICGYHQNGPRRVNLQLWNWRGLDVINAHERDSKAYVAGMREAVDAVASGRLRPWPLYTHVFDLNQADQAMDMARSRPTGFLKALISI